MPGKDGGSVPLSALGEMGGNRNCTSGFTLRTRSLRFRISSRLALAGGSTCVKQEVVSQSLTAQTHSLRHAPGLGPSLNGKPHRASRRRLSVGSNRMAVGFQTEISSCITASEQRDGL